MLCFDDTDGGGDQRVSKAKESFTCVVQKLHKLYDTVDVLDMLRSSQDRIGHEHDEDDASLSFTPTAY